MIAQLGLTKASHPFGLNQSHDPLRIGNRLLRILCGNISFEMIVSNNANRVKRSQGIATLLRERSQVCRSGHFRRGKSFAEHIVSTSRVWSDVTFERESGILPAQAVVKRRIVGAANCTSSMPFVGGGMSGACDSARQEVGWIRTQCCTPTNVIKRGASSSPASINLATI